jgi:hypothetical protein
MAAEIRDYSAVQNEIKVEWAAAVSAALATAEVQQEQARRWVDGGLVAEGFVVTPGPADAPST